MCLWLVSKEEVEYTGLRERVQLCGTLDSYLPLDKQM